MLSAQIHWYECICHKAKAQPWLCFAKCTSLNDLKNIQIKIKHTSLKQRALKIAIIYYLSFQCLKWEFPFPT